MNNKQLKGVPIIQYIAHLGLDNYLHPAYGDGVLVHYGVVAHGVPAVPVSSVNYAVTIGRASSPGATGQGSYLGVLDLLDELENSRV